MNITEDWAPTRSRLQGRGPLPVPVAHASTGGYSLSGKWPPSGPGVADLPVVEVTVEPRDGLGQAPPVDSGQVRSGLLLGRSLWTQVKLALLIYTGT